MLCLDKIVSRMVPLRHDQDAEDAARWQKMTADEKCEVLAYLRWQAKSLHAIREVGRNQDRKRSAVNSKNTESAT